VKTKNSNLKKSFIQATMQEKMVRNSEEEHEGLMQRELTDRLLCAERYGL
jgi:hypothetical protein